MAPPQWIKLTTEKQRINSFNFANKLYTYLFKIVKFHHQRSRMTFLNSRLGGLGTDRYHLTSKPIAHIKRLIDLLQIIV